MIKVFFITLIVLANHSLALDLDACIDPCQSDSEKCVSVTVTAFGEWDQSASERLDRSMAKRIEETQNFSNIPGGLSALCGGRDFELEFPSEWQSQFYNLAPTMNQLKVECGVASVKYTCTPTGGDSNGGHEGGGGEADGGAGSDSGTTDGSDNGMYGGAGDESEGYSDEDPDAMYGY